MASLRDTRTRISTIKVTRQVTSAMKMVSAARLKKAQDNVSHIRPYNNHLLGIIHDLITSVPDLDLKFTDPGKGEKVVLWVIASNRGLCGAFNSNVVKAVQNLLNTRLKEDYKKGNVEIRVMGKQAQKLLASKKILCFRQENDLLQTPSFTYIAKLADELMAEYLQGKIKKAILVYNEFENAAIQEVQTHQYLPIDVPPVKPGSAMSEYFFEPDRQSIIDMLIPKTLRSLFYQPILESVASEHGARMTSMHKATDNASDLIKELQLIYNKARQTTITNEIIEISSGAEALRS
jgi:F-type H+-transporting ATPase subunit gamma